MIDAALIRLRTVDLPAHTVRTLVQRMVPAAPPFRLERRVAWFVRYQHETSPDAIRERLQRPGVLHNPNKESLTLVHDATVPLVPARAEDACIVVWSRDQAGVLELASALGETVDALQRAVLSAERTTLWWLCSTEGHDMRSLAEEIAHVRGRAHGVLINPHLANGVVLHDRPTIERIACAMWPESIHQEAER